MSDGELQLEIVQGDGNRRKVTLDQTKSVRFGTSKLVEVVISGKDVRPLHCGVIWKRDHFELAAATAAKQVELNGTLVTSAVLKVGDRFRVGDVEITVVACEAPLTPTKATDAAGANDEISLAPLDEVPARKPAPAPKPANKPLTPTISSADEMVLAPMEDAPARPAKAVTAAAPQPAPKHEAAHDDEMTLAPLAADATPKTQGPKPAEQPLAKTGAVTVPHLEGKKEVPHDELTLAPLAADATSKTQGPSSPQKSAAKPAPKPATGPSANPSKPAATRLQSKPSTKPKVQPKKQPASPGKTGNSALGSSAAVLFGDELSEVTDLADISLTDLAAVPPGAGSTDPLAPLPVPPQTTVQRKGGRPGKTKTGKAQGAGKKSQGKAEPKDKGPSCFKSPRFWGPLVFLAVMGLGAYCAVKFPMPLSADEILAAAERDYGSGTLDAAAEKFDDFLRRHPGHPQADGARAHRALARLRALADVGGNWQAALATAQETVPSSADVLGHPDDRRHLAEALAKIAKGLLGESQAHVLTAGQTEAAQVAFDRTREAVALGRRWLPQRLRKSSGLDQTELDLARMERERGRALALEAAIHRIQAGDPDQARRELLDVYAELAADARLIAALAASAAAERDHVVFGPFEPPVPPEVGNFPTGGVSFASAIGQTAPAKGVVPVLAPIAGCAYGIDAASGRLLWRRFVGFDTSFVPRALDENPDSDLLLVDSTRSAVTRIKAQTGEAVWRTPLSAFDAEPIVAADRVLVACRNGDLVALDVAGGAARWKCSLPRPLCVGPAVDAARGIIYQLADEGQLYVLSESERKCIQVIYLGHDAGEIATPPVLVDRWLLVAGDAGLASGMLSVLATDNHPAGVPTVQTLALSGQVASPLLVHERAVYIATVGNGLESFRLGNDPTSPLVPGTRRRPDDGSPIVGRLSLAGGKLWLAGDGVTAFTLPLDEASLATAALVAAGQFAQPVVERGESLSFVAQLGGDSGIRVESLPTATPNSVTWTLDVGTAPAVGPVIDSTGTTVSILHRSDSLFQTPIDKFRDVAQFVSMPSDGTGASELSQVPQEPKDVEEFVRISKVAADTSELSRVPLPRVDSGSAVVFDDALIVCATERQPEALLVFNSTEPEPRLVRWPLPGKLACPPVRFGNELLLALERGGVYLVDPRSRELIGEPFGGMFKLDELPQWRVATTPDMRQAIVSDGRTLYRLVRAEPPSPGFVVEAKAKLDSPIESLLAVTSAQAAAADGEGRLVLFDIADLKPKAIAMDGAVVCGPLACGDRLLVATEDGRLACLAESEQIAWQVELPDGQPLSATADGDALIFASRRGVVWALAAATGDTLWRREIGQPLGGQILVAKQGIMVSTTDGTLYLLPRGSAGAK